MRALAMVLVLLLAGCAQDAPNEKVDDVVEEGTVRVLVVDASIQPVAGAAVQIIAGPNGTTNDDGEAVLAGLSPGVYSLRVTKAGFFDAQTDFEMTHDVPLVRVQMQSDASSSVFVQGQVHEGFVESGLNVAGARASNSDVPDFYYERIPDWFQEEMVWESTQPLGGGMEITLIAYPKNSTTGDQIHRASGTSPVIAALTQQEMIDAGVGTDVAVSTAIFPAPEEGGIPVSVALDQAFTVYIHHFYGFAPAQGWAFTQHGVPSP